MLNMLLYYLSALPLSQSFAVVIIVCSCGDEANVCGRLTLLRAETLGYSS